MADVHTIRDSFKVIRADRSYDPVLRNLFEFYLHDLAEWFKFDQQVEGNYTHSTERYWSDTCHVYLLYDEEIPVGFGLVGPSEEWLPGSAAKDMDEFFIVRRHRGAGIGRDFAKHLWRRYPGPWLVRVFQPNSPALSFWRRSISAFTGDRYEEDVREINGNNWSYFLFNSGDV